MRSAAVALCLLFGPTMAGCGAKESKDNRGADQVSKEKPGTEQANRPGQEKDAPGAWLVLRRDVGALSRLVVVDAREPSVQRLAFEDVPGRILSALVADRGRTLYAAVDGRQVWRIRTQPSYSAQLIWEGKVGVHLEAASADGSVLLAGHGLLLLVEGDRARLVDLDAPAQRVERSGELSEDGQRVLLAFVPAASCHEQPFAGEVATKCPLEIWGFDRRGGGWRAIVATERHNYNPRFVPGTNGEEIYFHSPVPDEKCRSRPLWGCGVEDLYRVRFDGSERSLVRNRTWVPRFSPDGKWMSASSPWDDGALLVGPPGEELRQIASDAQYALQWSADSKWIAYQGRGGETRIIRPDGTGAAAAGEKMPIGWLAYPVPVGDVVPATPPQAVAAPKPIEECLQAQAPESTGTPVAATLGNAVDIAGVEMPASVKKGETFRVTVHYHVRAPIERAWKIFVHFDGAGLRFQADHDAPCATTDWRPGAWVTDSFEVTASSVAGSYTAYTGFFGRVEGNWTRFPVTAGPHDPGGRVPLGRIEVR